MIGVLLLLVFGAASCQGQEGAGEERWQGAVMQPQLAQRNPGDSVAVLCQTPWSVQACQFKVRLETESKDHDLDVLDFGLGLGSATNSLTNGTHPLFTAAYHGTGLENGQCGLALTSLTAGRYFVGCRVRSGTSGWMYDFMALVVHTNRINQSIEFNKTLSTFPVDVVNLHQPLPTVWFPAPTGQKVNTCKFYLPYQHPPVLLTTSSALTINSTRHQVFLNDTGCGVQLHSASSDSNGIVWCLYRAGDVSDFRLFAPRVVAVRERPRASLNATAGNLTIGDTFTATCVAASGRPPARISWTLDGRTILDVDRDDDDASRPWVWPWNVRSVNQVLRIVLGRDDLGKRVVCRVSQPGGQDEELVALVNWDSSVCIDGFVMCNWAMILMVTAVVIAVVVIIVAIVIIRNRRDWRWT